MQKFLRKLILPIVLVLVLFGVQKHLVNSATSPFWGNYKLYNKVEFLLESEEQFDLILFGSSLTHRQLIPSIFEEELGLKTYNLGTPAMRNPETYYALEHFLKIIPREKHPKYLLLELQEVSYIDSKNSASDRAKYFVDHERLVIGMNKYASKSPRKTYIYFTNFLKSEFKIGLLRKQILSDQENARNYESFKNELQQYSGFFPFEEEETEGHLERRNDLLKRPEELDEIKEEVRLDVQNATAESVDIAVVRHMVDLCKSYEIEPVLILPARKSGNGIVRELGNIPAINMTNPDKYPQFYTLESSWDVSHLNFESAQEYSKIVCQEWKKHVWNENVKP